MPDLDYAKVTGRFGLSIGDTSSDVDDDPDLVWCDSGRVFLTPLNTFVKVPGGVPDPFTMGSAVIEASIDANGYLTYNGKPHVHVVDLTSAKVNPQIGPDAATHRVTFSEVKAGTTPVDFPAFTCRLTAAGPNGDGENDLTLLAPVVPGEAEPIFQGPRGVSVESASINPAGELVFDFTDGTQENAGEIPVTAEALGAAATATEAADTATEAATTATSKAGEASGAATSAGTAKTAAETAKADAETAKTAAETARDNLLAQKGTAGGLAELDGAGKLPETRVPERLTESGLSDSYARKGDWFGSAHVPADSPEMLTPTVIRYQPASLVQNQTPTDNSWEDLDATNLAVTFVCPPSGAVEVTLSATVATAAFDQGVIWGLKDTTSGLRINVSVMAIIKADADDGVVDQAAQRSAIITKRGDGVALTPGTTYTFVWQHRAARDAVASYTNYGGSGTNGPAVMRVVPLSNRLTQKAITSAIETAPEWQIHDAHPNGLTVIGQAGFGSIYNGRLGFSLDNGVTWTPLPNLLTPTGAAHVFYANDGEVLVVAGISTGEPGKIYKSNGWASGPATCTFTEVLSANNIGGTDTVYFGNYSGNHMHGPICVLNEYGPKVSAATSARYVYATQDHGDTWDTIFDLYDFIHDLFPSWDGSSAHVHASAYDPYWDAVWVTTGDYNGAPVLPYVLVSFDWRDNNPTWHKVYSRHQFTTVVPMKDCVLFGTDMGSSAADGIGNGWLRYNRYHPSRLVHGHEVILEPAYIYDTVSGISVIALGYSRLPWVKDAPYLLALGESGAVGPTGRILATYDGYSFREVWTATDSGTTGSIGHVVGPLAGKITGSYQPSTEGYQKHKVTLTLS